MENWNYRHNTGESNLKIPLTSLKWFAIAPLNKFWGGFLFTGGIFSSTELGESDGAFLKAKLGQKRDLY